ncbi:hypothetical protein PV416_43760 [Streptomyces ipomoeae]|jgi:hypothetical protein|uniref:Uncharacterized protein n=1 Tax=Streptomyces ipomoeae 91-03 TaxID=698759 RepID=L1KTN6_9ACTN|nr:hypothetical protein [Streptomyces ipomoeae]EKX64181.1 hypothetical protein STRIP9103_06416 [Streptomyces ipomoeae 91-03]MDX2697638.1 hypothetical protein [Streptomyces ipomoeae]MDX2827788.1 hypothetical protein [Streptomyces ipomoeae]MDX2843477.1 hypothetical protein [Streptomyces ipomoeae]MDX2880343.1 hypothetical protein [Streptomyces ipomoeae]
MKRTLVLQPDPAEQAVYKLRIVAEYDAAPKNEKGAILRRERLYHSHVKEWCWS